MYATIHSLIGAGTATFVPNPFGAFIIGVLLHFICDAIPHGDSSDHLSEAAKKKRMLLVFALDSFAWLMTFGIIILFAPLSHPVSLTAGALGGLFPDLLRVPYLVFHWKPLKTYCKIHDAIHRVLGWDVPCIIGLIEQITIFIFFLFILLQPF